MFYNFFYKLAEEKLKMWNVSQHFKTLKTYQLHKNYDKYNTKDWNEIWNN